MSVLYEDYEDLEEANKELLWALKQVRKAQEVAGGTMAKYSTTWNIANKAIAKHEVSDGI